MDRKPEKESERSRSKAQVIETEKETATLATRETRVGLLMTAVGSNQRSQGLKANNCGRVAVPVGSVLMPRTGGGYRRKRVEGARG
jgi:hypothetical protein